jgi:hypothetical protein
VPRDDDQARPEANVRLVSGVLPNFPLHRQSS